MTYVVGTTSLNVAGSYGPAGTLHALRAEEAFDGLALCGAEVHAWNDIGFPTGRPLLECDVCSRAAALDG